jgi:probable F420-dependent oxidoreductase
MAAPVQLGFFMPSAQMTASGPEPLGFEQILEITREAEDAGFHSLWWPDHYFIEAGPGQRRGSFECWTLLAALAARTSRIKLGSLVLCNTFRHPAVLAKQAASLQEISGGRVILGLGAGWHEPEYRALGLPFDHRVSRLAESAAAIRELFDDGTSSFEGRWLKLDDAALSPRPQQKVPLLIAASGPNILRLTARFADSWNLAWFGGNPEPFARKARELRAVCKDVGRDPGTLELTVGVQAQVAAEGGEGAAIEQIKRANPMLASLDDQRLKQRVMVGDAESVAGSLRGFADAGATLAIVASPGLAALPADKEATGRLFRDVTAALGAA